MAILAISVGVSPESVVAEALSVEDSSVVLARCASVEE